MMKAEAMVIYHCKNIKKKIKELEEQYEKLNNYYLANKANGLSDHYEVMTMIENEKQSVMDIIQQLTKKL